MDEIARGNLEQAVDGQRLFIESLKENLIGVREFMYADRDYWDIVVITSAFEEALKRASAGLSQRLAWSTALCSALIDEAVYSRGLLMHAARLANDIGLLHGVPQLDYLISCLLRGGKNTECIIVAYLDYVGTTDAGASVWSTFSRIGRDIAVMATDAGFASYYWRSSDAFYVFRITRDAEVATCCARLVDLLVRIQDGIFISDKPWMWQMGVSKGDNGGLGDIFLPGDAAVAAVRLMEGAKDKLRGGGAICVTAGFRNALPESPSVRFAEIMGDPTKGYYYCRSASTE